MTVSAIHERLLLDPLEAQLRVLGFETSRPFATHRFGYAGLIDLFAARDAWRVVVEAERTAERVHGDLTKAVAVRATHLLIVTPTRRVAEACDRQISRSMAGYQMLPGVILSRPVGPLVTVLTSLFPVLSDPVSPGQKPQPGDKS
ncbi:MAG: hypothetical protein ACE37H_01825 [Phycisphaeraceae bacterium]